MTVSSPVTAQSLAKGFAAHKAGDYVKAMKEWKPLAHAGNSTAQFEIGLLYEDGWGVARNYRESVKWYRLAAEQDNAKAQVNLGLMYAYGNGVIEDYNAAHMWFNIVSSLGHAGGRKGIAIVVKA